MYAALIAGTVVVTVALVAVVLLAVKFFTRSVEEARVFAQAHESTLASLERIHDKNMQQLSSMADRFMALDLNQFKGWQSVGEVEEGGFEEPDEPARVERQLVGGRFSVVGEGRELTAEEQMNEAALMREDFPPGWDEETG